MIKVKRSMFWFVIICLLACIGIYDYTIDKQRNNFNIVDVRLHADAKFWTDNTKSNIYDVKFKLLDGKDTKQITSKKSDYTMKISSSEKQGNIIIKVYNDNKTLFEKGGNINNTVHISGNDSKNVKVELAGKKAEGYAKIVLK